MFVHYKGVPIIPVQTVFRTEPHKPLVILEDTEHAELGKAMLSEDAIKSEALPGQKGHGGLVCRGHLPDQRCQRRRLEPGGCLS